MVNAITPLVYKRKSIEPHTHNCIVSDDELKKRYLYNNIDSKQSIVCFDFWVFLLLQTKVTMVFLYQPPENHLCWQIFPLWIWIWICICI